MYIVLLVVGIPTLGLYLFNLVRKPEPWPRALFEPLFLAGMILWSWSRLLPAAKTGAQRILMGLSAVSILAGLVLAILAFSRM
jgi:hypothetical protein